jgi:peptidoglycan/LPS O-acetylase OafA/YrhL
MTPNSKRLVELDVLRAVAVILVLGRHLHAPGPAVSKFIQSTAEFWNRIGWMGVDLFFVLSGFLVSGLLFREYLQHGEIRIAHFLIRRGLKIYPAFYVLLLLTPLIATIVGEPLTRVELLCEALFLQNYTAAYWYHTWTLAVEEHFYICLPVLLIWLQRRSNILPNAFASLGKIFLFISVYILLLRIGTVYFFPEFPAPNHLSHLRIDALFFGVLLSYYYHFVQERFIATVCRYRYMLLIAATTFLAPLFSFPLRGVAMFSLGLSASYLGFGILMVLMLCVPSLAKSKVTFRSRFLCFIGVHSYSIYLWHVPVEKILKLIDPFSTLTTAGYLGSVALYVSTSIFIGVLMAKAIELPIIKIRNRKFPSRSGSL